MLCLAGANATAQKGFSYNNIPQNEQIDITLLGSDNTLLHCYNLYGYVYNDGINESEGEFIVPKNADSFAEKTDINIKFCVVKEYFIYAKDTCRPMEVSTGINIRYPDKPEPVYLNFDPSLPDAVFIPCK